ncbi:MAG: hypothetical protein IKN53_04625 [Oscillibacter sp.]|nr:hypothetical protein [Oscillibacter sp.]
MPYLVFFRDDAEADEPYRSFSEYDENRRELRRAEFYRGGASFAYGPEFENTDALRREPFPQDLQELTEDGAVRVLPVEASDFYHAWETACSRSEGDIMSLLC